MFLIQTLILPKERGLPEWECQPSQLPTSLLHFLKCSNLKKKLNLARLSYFDMITFSFFSSSLTFSLHLISTLDSLVSHYSFRSNPINSLFSFNTPLPCSNIGYIHLHSCSQKVLCLWLTHSLSNTTVLKILN
jgi:hypothetical protein